MGDDFVSGFGDKDIVFKTDTSKFRIVKAWLQGDNHSGLKKKIVGMLGRYPGEFVDFKTNSVSQRVRHNTFCLRKD